MISIQFGIRASEIRGVDWNVVCKGKKSCSVGQKQLLTASPRTGTKSRVIRRRPCQCSKGIELLSNPKNYDIQNSEKGSTLTLVPFSQWGSSPRLMASCEVDKAPLKVAMLLSGGVDSSLALYLLKAAGHEVTAFYLQIWFQEDFRNFWDACPWEEDMYYCRKVCERLDIPLQIVPMSDQYWNQVVRNSIMEVKAGKTPNPDILCNSRVKFGAFQRHLQSFVGNEFDRIASGHYAHIERDPSDSSKVSLRLTPDKVKDQTYFLAQLSQAQLQKAMFPLGQFQKAEVRKLAEVAELPNTTRKDSQGICFLGKVKFDEFIREHLGEWPGPLVDEISGEVVGYHKGYWFYTVGQRRGIHLSGGPWYVTRKDIQKNLIYISQNYQNIFLGNKVVGGRSRSEFLCSEFNWLLQEGVEFIQNCLKEGIPIYCKVRHGPKMYTCYFQFLDKGEVTAKVRLDGIDQGLAPGQFAVFYCCPSETSNKSLLCIGCGKIIQ